MFEEFRMHHPMRIYSNLSHTLRLFVHEARGSTTILFALMSTVLFGAAALAIDYSKWIDRKSDMQATADSAALAGARLLAALASENDAKAAAQAFIASKASSSTSPIVATTARSVSVTLSENGSTYLASVLGFQPPQILVASEAVTSQGARPCIIALDPNAPIGIDFSLAGSVTAIDCAIWSNAISGTSFDLNGSGSASSAQNCAVGGISGSSFSITPTPEGNCPPALDPLLSWEPPAYAICDNSLPDKLNSGAITLSPGVYCGGLKLSGTSQVTLLPGIYVMKDGPLSVNTMASIVGDGVTILLTGPGSSVNFLGSSTAHLSAATSGPTEGLVIAAGRGEPVLSSKVGGGAEMDIEGTVYLPTHDLSYGGNSESLMPSTYSLLIARTISFHGGSQVVIRGDPATSRVPTKAAMILGSVRLSR